MKLYLKKKVYMDILAKESKSPYILSVLENKINSQWKIGWNIHVLIFKMKLIEYY
jgi:hypothetical protein